jgi:hypothetical protein
MKLQMIKTRRLLAAASPLVLGTALLIGCQTAHVAHPLTAELGGNSPESQMDFWHLLADRHVTSNDEAFHGVILFADGSDPAKTYADRVSLLQSRGMLAKNFHETADQAIERGTLAVMVVKTLNIKGGWAMHVFGPTPRYATKELVSMNLYPASSASQTFSGAEFLGIIGKMEDYQRGNDGGPAGGGTAANTEANAQ